MSKRGLKPCPFCRSGGEIVFDEGDCMNYVPRCRNIECLAHYIYFFGFDTEEKAIEAWNRRDLDKDM